MSVIHSIRCVRKEGASVAAIAHELGISEPTVSGSLRTRAGELLEDALAHLAFHREHWIRLRTNNVQECANTEITDEPATTRRPDHPDRARVRGMSI